MEAANASEFPKFRDGDVKLVIHSGQAYQIHANVLRRNSPYFAFLLAQDGPAEIYPATRRAGFTIRYQFDLVRPQGSGSGVGTFERKTLNKHGVPINSRHPFTDIDNGKVVNEQNKHWDWLFGVFYNIAPQFDIANLATTLSGCMGLVDVAESVHAVDNVRSTVDLALLRQGNVLWSSIAGNPIAWAELGRRVHSPTIFTEGIVHIVGQWNNISDVDKNDLHPDIRSLCRRKFDEIDIAKEAIEMRILGHYPDFLCRSAADRPGRPTYSNDIYMWMAICFFRQWFAQAISDGRNRLAPDAGCEFYHQIGAAGHSYLGHESFKNFHQYFPMSSKACNVLEANMNVMKEDVKQFVQDLLTNRANVDQTEQPLKWLTCALVTKEDHPWHVAEEEQQSASNDDLMGGLAPTAPLPHRPEGKKRRREPDEHMNGYAVALGHRTGPSADDADCPDDNED